MSRAFVKESDVDGVVCVPDRPISSHPNLVTPNGLKDIEKNLAEAKARSIEAQRRGNQEAMQVAERDIRYWIARRSTAQVVKTPQQIESVVFGVRVTIRRDDGREQTFRIVGEDEAQPAKGTISYVSPLAAALLGKTQCDEASLGSSKLQIVKVF